VTALWIRAAISEVCLLLAQLSGVPQGVQVLFPAVEPHLNAIAAAIISKPGMNRLVDVAHQVSDEAAAPCASRCAVRPVTSALAHTTAPWKVAGAIGRHRLVYSRLHSYHGVAGCFASGISLLQRVRAAEGSLGRTS
jgi:hypothetical protein